MAKKKRTDELTRRLRVLGWTGVYLAERLGVHINSVTDWRKRGMPQYVDEYTGAMLRVRELAELLDGVTRKP